MTFTTGHTITLRFVILIEQTFVTVDLYTVIKVSLEPALVQVMMVRR